MIFIFGLLHNVLKKGTCLLTLGIVKKNVFQKYQCRIIDIILTFYEGLF